MALKRINKVRFIIKKKISQKHQLSFVKSKKKASHLVSFRKNSKARGSNGVCSRDRRRCVFFSLSLVFSLIYNHRVLLRQAMRARRRLCAIMILL